MAILFVNQNPGPVIVPLPNGSRKLFKPGDSSSDPYYARFVSPRSLTRVDTEAAKKAKAARAGKVFPDAERVGPGGVPRVPFRDRNTAKGPTIIFDPYKQGVNRADMGRRAARSLEEQIQDEPSVVVPQTTSPEKAVQQVQAPAAEPPKEPPAAAAEGPAVEAKEPAPTASASVSDPEPPVAAAKEPVAESVLPDPKSFQTAVESGKGKVRSEFVCKQCGKQMADKRELIGHLRSAH